MIKIEWYFEEGNNYLENLDYQIAKIYGFYKKVPVFHKKLDDLENHFDLLETKRRIDAYRIVMNELESFIKKCKNK